jgi:hypothetical protein
MTRYDTALVLCIIVFVIQAGLNAHEAVTDYRLTISVRAYADFDRIEAGLEKARAYIADAFRHTDIELKWLVCFGPHAPLHCQSPLAPDEVIVRIMAAPEAVKGTVVPLGDSLVDPQTRSGCLATVYVDRVVALARRLNVAAGPILGRAIAHEIGHLLLGTTRHSDSGLMRAVWSPKELTRNDRADWIFLDEEVAAIRAVVAMRLARSALASR